MILLVLCIFIMGYPLFFVYNITYLIFNIIIIKNNNNNNNNSSAVFLQVYKNLNYAIIDNLLYL